MTLLMKTLCGALYYLSIYLSRTAQIFYDSESRTINRPTMSDPEATMATISHPVVHETPAPRPPSPDRKNCGKLPVDITAAIEDPFDYGYEGRVPVDRQLSARRKPIATILSHYAAKGIFAPLDVQYEYLVCYGFYTPEELKDHPGYPK